MTGGLANPWLIVAICCACCGWQLCLGGGCPLLRARSPPQPTQLPAGVILSLFCELNPALDRRKVATFNWLRCWAGFYLSNLVIPFCMLYTFSTSHIGGSPSASVQSLFPSIRKWLAGWLAGWLALHVASS